MLTPKVWPKLLRSFLPKCLVLKTGPVSSLVTEKYSLYEQFPIPSLVAVATQCVNNRTREVWLKHSRSSQLTDLFRWLGNRQVARSALAVLDLAFSGHFVPLLHSLVGFLLGHDSTRDLQRLNGTPAKRGERKSVLDPLGKCQPRSATRHASSQEGWRSLDRRTVDLWKCTVIRDGWQDLFGG